MSVIQFFCKEYVGVMTICPIETVGFFVNTLSPRSTRIEGLDMVRGLILWVCCLSPKATV